MASTPLNIKDPEAYQLASAIAQKTGKTLTRVVIDALRAEAERIAPVRPNPDAVMAKLAKLHRYPAAADEPLLYDDRGLPA